METFQEPITNHMARTVYTVHVGASLEEVDQQMTQRGVSGLIVMSDDGLAIGVITRTDLMRAARVRPGLERAALSFDTHLSAREAMHADPLCIEHDKSLADAARLMAKAGVHRLMVVEGTEPVGIVSVTDMLAAVADSAIATPLSELASESIAFLQATDTVGYAIDRLRVAGVRGLVVMDAGWPAGVFGQLEALAARDAAPEAPVGTWMNPAVVCAGPRTPVHRAAAQALAMHAPLIVVVDGDKATGVVSSTDVLYTLL